MKIYLLKYEKSEQQVIMLLQTVINKAANLPNAIQEAYANEIKKACQEMLQEYDIFHRGTRIYVTQEEIMSRICVSKDHCQALTKAGTKCVRKCQDNSNFCKIHMYKVLNNSISGDTTNNVVIVLPSIQSDSHQHLNKSNVSQKFIDDAFYFVDEKYIYDKESGDIVGYVDGDQYILSRDPFIIDGGFN